MPAATDLLLDAAYDLVFTDAGDVATGLSDAQHQALLLLTAPGEWRTAPLVGIGLRRYQNAPLGPAQVAALQREVTIQLVKDGYQVLDLDLSNLAAARLNAVRP